MDFGKHLQFLMCTDLSWLSVVTFSTGLVVSVANSGLGCYSKKAKTDAPCLCTHRVENLTTHNAASIDRQRPLQCVLSNLAQVACHDGITAASEALTTTTTIVTHSNVVTACDIHSDLNSSTVSLTGDCFHATATTVAPHCSKYHSLLIPLQLVTNQVASLAFFLTNHNSISEENLSFDKNSNYKLTSCISHEAQFAKMYPIDSNKSNETKENVNSDCKYLSTATQVDRHQTPVNRECTVDGGHLSSAKYQIYSPLPAMQKTSQVRLPCRPVAIWWTQLFFFIMLISQISQPSVNASANIRAIEKQILDKIIGPGSGYDSRIRPMGNGTTGPRGGDGPSTINVNILIRSISDISDLNMEYSVQLTFRQEWIDSRLKFDDKGGQINYLVLTEPEKVWRPDLFFKNEKEGHSHEIIVPNVLFRIYPTSGVLYSIRISLVLACPMDLKYYPLDKQICGIQMASYGYTDEDLVFIWKHLNPVQITKHLHLPRFTLEKYRTDYCTSKTNTGAYSCLEVSLLFKREFSFYLIQIYIPCCMLVIVSWVSFWLDPNAIPARVSLGVMTLLTMATSISGINSSLPPVSYTKAIDVWTGVCLTFVFGALLEFALVNYASRSDTHRAALKQQQSVFVAQRKWDLEDTTLDVDPIDERASAFAMRPLVQQQQQPINFSSGNMRSTCEIHMSLPTRNWCKRWLSKFPTRSKRIDVISRIFFPLMFALFNLVYWTTYLFREDMQNLNQKLKI